MALNKSNLKLEDIRKYISHIRGFFGVPFGDGGFLMSNEEIIESKKAYDEFFSKTAAMILGITPEEVDSMTTKKNDNDMSKPYNWCWKHNLTYKIQVQKDSNRTISIGIEYQRHNIYFKGMYGSRVGNFYIDENGDILQDTDKVYNSFDEILDELDGYEVERITKELDKLKETEKKKRKALESTQKKIKELEAELNKMK